MKSKIQRLPSANRHSILYSAIELNVNQCAINCNCKRCDKRQFTDKKL